MKSLADILAALHEVRNALLDDRVPLRRAGIILFGLQQAAIPLRQPRPAQN
jgi:hypothetical protein